MAVTKSDSSSNQSLSNGVVVAEVEVKLPPTKKAKLNSILSERTNCSCLIPHATDFSSKTCCSIEITDDSINMCSNPISNSTISFRPTEHASFFIKLCESCETQLKKHQFCPHCGMRCQLLDYQECADGHRTHTDCVQLQKEHGKCPHCEKKFMRERRTPKTRPPAANKSYKIKYQPFKFTTVENQYMAEILTHYLKISPVNKSFTAEQVRRAIDSSYVEKIAEILKSPVESILHPIAGISIFDYCIKKKRLDLAEVFHKFGVSPNKRFGEEGKFSILIDVVQSNELRSVQYCLKSGVDTKRIDDNGRTAAHLSAQNCSRPIVKMLVNAENIPVQDLTGFTCIHWALENPDMEVFKYIVENCNPKDLYIPDRAGKNVLHWAAQYGYAERCKILLEKDQQLLSTWDQNSASPIYYAAQLEENKAVQTLGVLLQFYDRNLHAMQKKNPADVATGRAKVLLQQIEENCNVESRKYQRLNGLMVIHDVANGKESFPVHVINGIDDLKFPSFTVVEIKLMIVYFDFSTWW